MLLLNDDWGSGDEQLANFIMSHVEYQVGVRDVATVSH